MAGTSIAVQGSSAGKAEDDLIPWDSIAEMNNCLGDPDKVAKLIQILGADNVAVHGVAQFMDHCFTSNLYPFMLMPE